MKARRRRTITLLLAVLIAGAGIWYAQYHSTPAADNASTASQTRAGTGSAAAALGTLAIKGRAPKTGYSRQQFGGTWASEGSCTMRDLILARDLTDVKRRSDIDCDVMSGTLNDPYTGTVMQFVRGPGTSSAIQIDHVVAIGDAWQTGAQQLTAGLRAQLYNDPLELLAVNGKANDEKSDGDAATWLPSNKAYRCRYVARQIAIKQKYHLWLTQAEHDAMSRTLSTCSSQELPATQ